MPRGASARLKLDHGLQLKSMAFVLLQDMDRMRLELAASVPAHIYRGLQSQMAAAEALAAKMEDEVEVCNQVLPTMQLQTETTGWERFLLWQTTAMDVPSAVA